MSVWTPQELAILQMAATAPAYLQLQSFQKPTGICTPQQPQSINIDDESESDEDDEQKRTLFVANLDDRVTEEILYELFLQAGPIESVRIPKDNTGRQRTFGFITYVHMYTTEYAMRLYQGLLLFRKNLTIKGQAPSSSSSSQRRPVSNGDSFNVRLHEFTALRNQSAPAINIDLQHKETNSLVRNPFNQQPREWTKSSPDKRSDSHDRRDRHSRKHNDSPYQRKEVRHGDGDRRDQKDHGNQKNFGADRRRNRRR